MPLTLPPRMTMRLIRSARFRLAGQRTGDVRQRAEADDRDVAGRARTSSLISFSAGCWRASLETAKPRPAEAVGAVQVAAIGIGHVLGGGRRAEPRIAGRIEPLDDRLDIERRPLGRHVAGHRGDRHDLQPRIEQGQRQGQRIVDSRIAVDDDFAGHATSVRWWLPGNRG